MKKMFAGLFVAIMMAAGLVASSGSAQAARDCPYTGCVPTNTHVTSPGKVKVGNRARICVRVGTNGNGQPKGWVSIRVTRDQGGYEFSASRKYNGSPVCFWTTKLPQRGSYSIWAHFEAKQGSAYQSSNDSAGFWVTRRGHN